MALLRSKKPFVFDYVINFLGMESETLEYFVYFLNKEVVFLNVSRISQVIFE